MFEHPTITDIGEASDLILGIASIGSDLDSSWVPDTFEFSHDGHSGAEIAP